MKNKVYIRTMKKFFNAEIKGIDYRYSKQYYINKKGRKIVSYYRMKYHEDGWTVIDVKISKKEYIKNLIKVYA